MTTRLLLALALLAPLVAPAAPTTAADLVPLFMPAQLYQPKLSPKGDYLGFMVRQNDSFAIGVFDFATRKMQFKGGDNKIIPLDFWWKTPNRLLVKTTSDTYDAIGYTAFNADGSDVQDIWHMGGKFGVIYDALPAEPNKVLMLRRGNIVKVNIDKDIEEDVVKQLNRVQSWIVDELGQPRAAMQDDWQHGESDMWWNKTAGGAWQVRTFTSKDKRFYPRAVATDPRYLLGWELSPDATLTISQFDTTTGEVTALPSLTGRDPTALLTLGLTRKPIAISYEQGARMKLVPLAESDRAGVARMEKQYAGYLTRILDTMPDGKNWLLWVGNSRLPGAYVLFNHETSESYALGFSHDGALVESRFAFGEYMAFQRRDGGALVGRLWRPAKVEQPPLIVICPEELPARIVADVYQPDVQAFVQQGFAVLRINPRNSWGFGPAGRSLPHEQWIPNLQEDIDDAVQSLIDQKAVDPARINLYGEDFGGVLALQIGARSKLFKAVATINVQREVHRDDLAKFSTEGGTNPLAAKFGGWFESEKFARDLSPLKLVATLPLPALYLHNEESIKGRLNDDGRAIRDAAKNAATPAQSGSAYTWSQYPKLPTKFAQESAEISVKVATFFNSPVASK